MSWPLQPVNDLGPVPRPALEVEINGLLVDAQELPWHDTDRVVLHVRWVRH